MMSLKRFRNLGFALIFAAAPAIASTHVAAAAPHQVLHQSELHPAVTDLAAKQAVLPVAGLTSLSPAAPQTVIPLRAAANRPQREIFGFVYAGNLGNSSVGYPSWNLDLLTTVAYFGFQVNSGDGHLVTSGTGWTVFHSTTMTNFVNVAHQHGVRVIVSLNL